MKITTEITYTPEEVAQAVMGLSPFDRVSIALRAIDSVTAEELLAIDEFSPGTLFKNLDRVFSRAIFPLPLSGGLTTTQGGDILSGTHEKKD